MAECIETLELQSAMLVYSDVQNDQFYVETHRIEKGKLLEGRPAQKEALEQMAKSIMKQKRIISNGIIPTTLLAMNDASLAWFFPAQYRYLYFTDRLNIPNGKAGLPPLVFVLRNQTLSVFALKANRRPNLKTRLYNAPFHNVHYSGEVCLGNAKVKKSNSIAEKLVAWENAFFGSEFSSILHDPLEGTKNVNLIWKDAIENEKSFPKECLVEHRIKNVKNLLRNFNL